jgi:hypothetical protein
MPGPRNEVPELRLALSKLLLKMNGMPSADVISFRRPAVSICNCSRFDHAGAGDQEQGPVQAHLESAQLHDVPQLCTATALRRLPSGLVVQGP